MACRLRNFSRVRCGNIPLFFRWPFVLAYPYGSFPVLDIELCEHSKPAKLLWLEARTRHADCNCTSGHSLHPLDNLGQLDEKASPKAPLPAERNGNAAEQRPDYDEASKLKIAQTSSRFLLRAQHRVEPRNARHQSFNQVEVPRVRTQSFG